jgi:putative methyltransferase (TIGR04325 family)
MLTKLLSNFFNKNEEIKYYKDWQASDNESTGYDNDAVLETFIKAALAVGKGNALYECDGKTYNHFADNGHLVSALQHMKKTEGKFQVLDFGGALGGVYRQHRWFLSDFTDFVWCVVDKGRFVEKGRVLFTNNKLKFASSIKEAVDLYQPNIAVLSNVLQRMECPFGVLEELAQSAIPYVFIDFIPVISHAENRVTRSFLPAVNDKTAYPSWHFSETLLRKKLQENYRILNEFDIKDKKLTTRNVGFFCQKK